MDILKSALFRCKKQPSGLLHALTGLWGGGIVLLLPIWAGTRAFCALSSSLKSEQTVSREDVTNIRRLTRASGEGSQWCDLFHSGRITNILS